MPLPFPSSADEKLIQIVDASLAEATRKSGAWLACRPGCTQCCIGVFPINQLDARRLKRGLARLDKESPQRAAAVRARAIDSVARLSSDFPGDLVKGILDESSRVLSALKISRTTSLVRRSILRLDSASFMNIGL